MLLLNTSSRKEEEVADSKVNDLVRGGGYTFLGGPETTVHVRGASGQVMPAFPGRAAAIIQEGGSYINPGDLQRIRDNEEFAGSMLGSISAVPYGVDDWMFAGAGGVALEAMGLTPEGQREEVQAQNPFIWNAAGLPVTAAAILGSGGTFGAARAAGGAALGTAKLAARQASKSAGNFALGEAAKQMAKAGYYTAKGVTVSPFNLVTASDIAGNWAGQNALRGITHLAGKAVPTGLHNSKIARMMGPAAGRIADATVRGLVEGGIYGAGEGVSESMLGPPEEMAESILNHIQTNALIGAAFGGAVGSVIPVITGAKRAMLETGKLGMKGVGKTEEVVLRKTQAYLLALAKQTDEYTDEQLAALKELTTPGDVGDKARKEMIGLITNLREYVGTTAEHIEAALLIEDLIQMADTKGHARSTILKRIEEPNYDLTLTKKMKPKKAGPIYDKLGNPVTKKEEVAADLFDPGKKGEVPVSAEARKKVYELPGTHQLFAHAVESFDLVKSTLLSIASDPRNAGVNSQHQITKMVKKVMDIEAKFLKRMFSEETYDEFLRNAVKSGKISSTSAPAVTPAEKRFIRGWEAIWKQRADKFGKVGREFRKLFRDAAVKLGMAPPKKPLVVSQWPEAAMPPPTREPLVEVYKPHINTIGLAMQVEAEKPLMERIVKEWSEGDVLSEDELLHFISTTSGGPVGQEVQMAIGKLTGELYGMHAEEGKIFLKVSRRESKTGKELPPIFTVTGNIESKFNRWIEDYKEDTFRKQVKEYRDYKAEKARRELEPEPVAPAEPVKPAEPVTPVSDELKQEFTVTDYLLDGGVPTLRAFKEVLGMTPKEAKEAMAKLEEMGVVYDRGRGKQGKVNLDLIDKAVVADTPVPVYKFNEEEFEAAIQFAADTGDVEPILEFADMLGIRIKGQSTEDYRQVWHRYTELLSKEHAGPDVNSELRHLREMWEALQGSVDLAVGKGTAHYGALDDLDNMNGLNRILNDFKDPPSELNAAEIGGYWSINGPSGAARPGKPLTAPGMMDQPMRIGEIDKTASDPERIVDILAWTDHVLREVLDDPMKSSAITADLYKVLEDLSTDLHQATKYGVLKNPEVAARVQTDVIDTIRGRLRDTDLWLGQGAAKEHFDDLAAEYKDYREEIIRVFTDTEGGMLVAKPEKIMNYIRGLNKHNVEVDTNRLRGYVQKGIELLSNINKYFDPVDLMELGNLDADELNRFRKRWAKLGFPSEVPNTIKDGKQLWAWYLENVIARMKDDSGSLTNLIDKLRKDYPLAKMFMAANAQNANLSQVATELGRGGIASFVAYAMTGSPMASAAAGMSIGAATMAQDPKRLVNFLHLLSSFKKGTDKYLDESIKAWREGALTRMAETKGWEKKARQMLLVSPGVVTKDIRETQQEMEGRKSGKKNQKYWTDRATKSFSGQLTREQYVETRESLTKLVMNPAIMDHFLEKATEVFESAPDIREAIKSSMRQRVQKAYRIMPKGTRAGAFSPMIPPTTIELRKWGTALQMLNNPLDSVFGAMMSGTLTEEMVKTFKESWPFIYNEVAQKALETINNPKFGEMSQQQRMMLNILLEGQFLNPSVAERLLQNYREEEGKKKGGAPQSAAPRMMKNETEQMITAMESPVEQILA